MAKKQSYGFLRRESRAIGSLSLENHLNAFQVILRTGGDVPMYALRGYKLRSGFYGQSDIPLELQEVEISELPPASSARPTGISAYANGVETLAVAQPEAP
jgi:hypothetical protein